MILAIVNIGGEDKMKVYRSLNKLHEELFCANSLAWATDFKIKGKTYQERKRHAKDIGVIISNNRGIEDMTFDDAMFVAENLHNIAHRYGLVKEFRERGLI